MDVGSTQHLHSHHSPGDIPGMSKISPQTCIFTSRLHPSYFQLNYFWDTSGTHRILKHWSPKIEKCNHHSSRCSSYMLPTIQMFEDIQMSKGPYFSLFNLAFWGHLKDTATLHLFIFFCPGHLLLRFLPSILPSLHPSDP